MIPPATSRSPSKRGSKPPLKNCATDRGRTAANGNEIDHASRSPRVQAMAERYTVAQVPFWIWDDVRVTVETVSARLEITRPDEIPLYATVFDELRQSAVYGSHARELISEATADHMQHCPPP